MWKNWEISHALRRSSLIIAYLFLVMGAVIAFTYMQSVTSTIERESMVRTTENCEAVNRTKEIISAIIDRLADDQPSDDFEELVERQRLRADLDELLVPNECPPLPPD